MLLKKIILASVLLATCAASAMATMDASDCRFRLPHNGRPGVSGQLLVNVILRPSHC